MKKFLLLLIITCTAFSIVCMDEYIKYIYSFFGGTTKQEQEVHDFFKAVAEGNIALVKDFPSYSDVVNAQDKAGNSALMLAVKTKNVQMAQELLRKGVYINKANNAGETPLILAIKQKDLPMVKVLLNAEKVDIDRSDNDNNTPLMHAVNTHDIEIIKAILAEIPHPRLENKAGKRAMDLATTPKEQQLITNADERFSLFSMLKGDGKPTPTELENIEVFTTLGTLELGAPNLFRRAIESRNVDIVTSFVNKAIEINKDFINQPSKEGRTPLLVAVDVARSSHFQKEDDFKIIEFLLQKGAEPNVVGLDGEIPLVVALRDPKITELLVKYGADVDYQIPPDNKTLLMLAIERGDVYDVKKILELNPDLSLQNSKGQTAREVAEEAIRAGGQYVPESRSEILAAIKEAAKMPKIPSKKPIITPPVGQPLISALQKLTQSLNDVSKNILK